MRQDVANMLEETNAPAVFFQGEISVLKPNHMNVDTRGRMAIKVKALLKVAWMTMNIATICSQPASEADVFKTFRLSINITIRCRLRLDMMLIKFACMRCSFSLG